MGLLFNSCEREKIATTRPIVAEQFASTKMAVSGRTAEWVAGDEVKINSTTATVALSNGNAYLQGDVYEANVYRAIYPASIAPSGVITDDTVSITLPSTYTYREANGKQQLALPMAAAGREFPLTFKHLTAGLVVNVNDSIFENNAKVLYIDKIVVTSSGYKLSGGYTFDITDITNSTLCTESSNDDTTITMNFTEGAVSVSFGNSNSKNFVIPVPAVGSSNKFKVTVSGHYINEERNTVFVAKTRRQEVGGSLGRNTLAYVPVRINKNDKLGADDIDTEEDDDGTILISSKNEFDSYASLITAKSGGFDTMRYRLTTDIDYGGGRFTPIENFAGTFDGDGHTIKNIRIMYASSTGGTFKYYTTDWTSGSPNTTMRHFGLFTKLGGAATIKNLTLQNVVMDIGTNAAAKYNSSMMIGAFVAYTTKDVTIQNCTVDNFSIVSVNSISNKSFDKYVQVGICVGYAACNVVIDGCTVSNSTPTAVIYNTDAVGSGKRHHMYYGGLVGLLGSGTFTATNNTLSGAMHVAFRGGYNASNNGRYYTGTLLGCKATGATSTFTGNTSTGMQLYKPNGTTANAETTQGHQESGN